MSPPEPLADRPLLTVVSNADQHFLPGLQVAVASAILAASGRYDYEFRILDGGVDPSALGDLASVVARIGRARGVHAALSPLPIDHARLRTLPPKHGSRMHYAKLVLPEALAHLDACVYLDADVLCLAGLEAVRPPPGEEGRHLLAGVLDYFRTLEMDCPWLEQVPLAERSLPYVNSGILWMNLRGLRAAGFTDEAIAARAAVPTARTADQAVFNYLCRGRIHVLPEALNDRTVVGATGPLCAGDLERNIHLISVVKPWLGPARTRAWLAHQLWHQAYRALVPDAPAPFAWAGAPPIDRAAVRRKALLYRLLNPRRAALYRSDLRSLEDPAGVMEQAATYWSEVS